MLKTVQTGTGGGGGTPGGSTLQVQYNNAGAFGGMSGTSWDDANRSLTITGATVTTSNPIVNATQTWNAGAVTFTGLQFNVTDTASASGSLLMDLQVGGASKASIRKDGKALFNTLSVNNGSYQFRLSSATLYFEYPTVGIGIGFDYAGTLTLPSAGNLNWSSTSGSSGSLAAADLSLYRDAADTLAQRRGTNAQTLRIYNTYTDASNYERGSINWSTTANAFTIGTEAAGTGTARQLQLATAGFPRWIVNGSGHFVGGADNAYDIGASGSSRPRNIYVAGKATIGGGVLPRVTSATSASSLTPDASANDMYAYTALAANLTINAPTGSPVDGQKLSFRFLDNGTARTLTWNATFTAIGVTLPTTTTISKTLYVGCIYNSNNTRWDVVSIAQEA